jgi:hypothetical protein
MKIILFCILKSESYLLIGIFNVIKEGSHHILMGLVFDNQNLSVIVFDYKIKVT